MAMICHIGILVLLPMFVFSQRPDFSGQNPSQSGGGPPMQAIEEPDTTSIFQFYPDDPSKMSIQADTLLDQFHIYDMAEQGQLFSQSLGNLGSSTRHLFYQTRRPQNGFDFGYHQFDLYRLKRQEFQQIDSEKAVSNLFFTPGSNQRNFLIKTQFSRPFKNDIQLTIDYQRIIQEGIYTSQNTRTTSLGVSFRKEYDNRDMIITAVTNANNEVHNGGVSDETLFNQLNYNFRTRIPTFIENAFTRHADADFAVNNYFTLEKYKGIKFRHEIAHKRASFKYVDESSANSSFYGDLWQESRGLRSFTNYKKWESTLWGTLDVKNILLTAGFNYSFYHINQEPESQQIHDLSILANAKLTPIESIDIEADGYVGMGENVGEYSFTGSADLHVLKNIELTADASFKRFRPTLISQQAFINQLEVWYNDFSQPLENTLGASLHLSSLGLSIKFAQTALTNPIYFNTETKPEQFSGTVLISQLYLKSHHKLAFIQIKNEIGLQNLDTNIFNLPRLLSEHELYAEGYIFKKRMKARLGFRIKTVESYLMSGYSPAHGAFYFQNETRDPFFYQGDAYISFKVDSLRAFIRAENLTQLFIPDVFQLTNPYPVFDYRLRFGVGWSLFN